MSDNPFAVGGHIPDAIYDALVPLDGYPKGSRGGPRPYVYSNGAKAWWVVVSVSDFGDEFVGQSGPIYPDGLAVGVADFLRHLEAERFAELPFWRKVLAVTARQGPGQR